MKSLKKTARRGSAQAIFTALEALEPRQMLSTYLVTNTRDSGGGSLRQAIINANNNIGPDVINFQFNGTSVRTIKPLSQLPDITDDGLVINGFSQNGASPNTAPMTDPINAVYKIEIDGSRAGDNAAGFRILDSNDNEIRGLVINRFSYGVVVRDGNANVIAGNILGANTTGTAAVSPVQGSGVFAYFGASNTTIGGENAADRNLISGNSVGIASGGDYETTIQGNFIGTDITGMKALPNDTGISMNSQDGAFIFNNVISGNTVGGISAFNTTSDVTIQSNLIGVNRLASGNIGNGFGIELYSSVSGAASFTLIGGEGEEGNIIANSVGNGISIYQLPGQDAPVGNTILGNSIYGNGGLGIDLGNDGVTDNDFLDGDLGPNGRQNAPVITTAVPGTHAIGGTLNSTPFTFFTVQVFSSTTANSGRLLLGTAEIFTDANGDAEFSIDSPSSVNAGQTYTATATRASAGGYGVNDADGNTSEFSAGFAIPPADNTPYVLPNDVNIQLVNGKLQITGGSAGNKLDILIVPPKKGQTLAQFTITGLGPTTINGERSVTISASGIASIIMGNFNDEISITSKGKRFSLDGAIIETKLGEDTLSLNNVVFNGGKINMGFGRDSLLLKKTIVSPTTQFDFRRTQLDAVIAKNSKINLSQVFIPE